MSDVADRMVIRLAGTHQGPLAFGHAVGHVEGPIAEAIRNNASNIPAIVEAQVLNKLASPHADFGPFLRLLVQVVALVASAPQSVSRSSVSYLEIVRSRLSLEQMLVVWYYSRLPNNSLAADLRDAIERLELLRYLSLSQTAKDLVSRSDA